MLVVEDMVHAEAVVAGAAGAVAELQVRVLRVRAAADAAFVAVATLRLLLPLLADGKFKAEKQIKIANNVKAMHSGENIAQILGGVAFTIPHSDLVEQQYLNGELLKPTPVKRETKEFRNRIEEIAEEVFGV